MMDSMLNFVLNICVQSIIDPQSKNLNNLIAVFGVSIDHTTWSKRFHFSIANITFSGITTELARPTVTI